MRHLGGAHEQHALADNATVELLRVERDRLRRELQRIDASGSLDGYGSANMAWARAAVAYDEYVRFGYVVLPNALVSRRASR